MKKLLVVVMLLMAACRDKQPPAPTAQQSNQLNDAEDMLNSMAANEEGPADQGPHQSNTLMGTHSTGPSNRSD